VAPLDWVTSTSVTLPSARIVKVTPTGWVKPALHSAGSRSSRSSAARCHGTSRPRIGAVGHADARGRELQSRRAVRGSGAGLGRLPRARTPDAAVEWAPWAAESPAASSIASGRCREALPRLFLGRLHHLLTAEAHRFGAPRWAWRSRSTGAAAAAASGVPPPRAGRGPAKPAPPGRHRRLGEARARDGHADHHEVHDHRQHDAAREARIEPLAFHDQPVTGSSTPLALLLRQIVREADLLHPAFLILSTTSMTLPYSAIRRHAGRRPAPPCRHEAANVVLSSTMLTGADRLRRPCRRRLIDTVTRSSCWVLRLVGHGQRRRRSAAHHRRRDHEDEKERRAPRPPGA
jgi:hypothetical protein